VAIGEGLKALEFVHAAAGLYSPSTGRQTASFQALKAAWSSPLFFGVVFVMPQRSSERDLVGEAAPHGLELLELVEMPVNNLLLVFVKAGPAAPGLISHRQCGNSAVN
jgi:hypothetical protein